MAPTTTPLDPMITSQTYGATPPSALGGPIPSPFVPDTTDGAPYHTFNQYSQERRLPKHQLMFTVVEWNQGTPAASRDLMVTETNLETGRPREHQVQVFLPDCVEQVRLSTTSARQLADAAPMLAVPLLGDLLEVARG
eukprot:s3839_g1.t1